MVLDQLRGGDGEDGFEDAQYDAGCWRVCGFSQLGKVYSMMFGVGVEQCLDGGEEGVGLALGETTNCRDHNVVGGVVQFE